MQHCTALWETFVIMDLCDTLMEGFWTHQECLIRPLENKLVVSAWVPTLGKQTTVSVTFTKL